MRITKRKTIRKIDFIVVAITLLTIAVLIGYSRPLIISPTDNLLTTNTSILFSFEKGDYIILDDNLEFSSPEKIYTHNDLVLNLKPGIYYWRIEGALQSKVRKLIIESRVELKLIENDTKYDVVNFGNVPLNVSVYNKSVLVGNIVDDVGEIVNVSGNEYIGRENEE